MARRKEASPYTDFDQIAGRMKEIVGQVRDDETSLERSLDLFDEAIALGARAVEMVDATNFTPAELERLADQSADGAPKES